ncbi:MAG: hypothetical protein QW701_05960 [Candidatus Nezhaarchaeales archaeon]
MASRPIRLALEDGSEVPWLTFIVCFPKPSGRELQRRLQQLLELGVTELILDGPQNIDHFKVLGKGCDSIIVKALAKNIVVALKIRRTDSHVRTLAIEGENQKLANSVGVGAKVYGFSDDFIVMDIVNGLHIDSFVEKASNYDAKRVVIDLLKQCRRLDLLHLDHGELSRAHRHVMVTPDLKPVIIDFGSSSRVRKPSNVSSIFNFLFLSKRKLSALLLEKLGVSLIEDEAIKMLREYKRGLSEELFTKLLSMVSLGET